MTMLRIYISTLRNNFTIECYCYIFLFEMTWIIHSLNSAHLFVYRPELEEFLLPYAICCRHGIKHLVLFCLFGDFFFVLLALYYFKEKHKRYLNLNPLYDDSTKGMCLYMINKHFNLFSFALAASNIRVKASLGKIFKMV